jgi:WD40 repeat protein/tetratricopeptide (TPR) repeat protein
LQVYETQTGRLISTSGGVISRETRSILAVAPSGEIVFASRGGIGSLHHAGTGRPIGDPIQLGDGALTAAAFSPDGERLAIGTTEGRLGYWDARDGREISQSKPFGAGVYALAFSPDGERLAVGTGIEDEGRAFVVNASDFRQVAALPASRTGVFALAFRGDGSILAAAGNGRVWLWDVAADRAAGAVIEHRGQVTRVRFSPDGRSLLVASNDGAARFWDGDDGRPVGPILEHGAAVYDVAFSPDGRIFFTASKDGTVRGWDALPCLPPGRPLPLGELVQVVDVSRDGAILATGSFDGTARLFEASTGRPVGPPLLHQDKVRAVRFSPDGKTLATGSDDRTVRLWDVATGRPLGGPLDQVFWTWDLAFDPSGKVLLVACVGHTARLWDLERRAPIGPVLSFPDDVTGKEVRWAFLGRGGRVAVACTTGGSVWFWDSATGRHLTPGPVIFGGGIRAALLSPDDRTLVVVAGDRIHTLDLEQLAEVGQPFGQNIASIACSPRGQYIVSGGADRVARRWDVATRRPAGPPMDHPGQVWSVAYSPDGRMLLTATREGGIRYWDAATGKPIGPHLVHGADLSRGFQRGGGGGVLFAPGGGYAVSYGEFARIWPVPRIDEGDVGDLQANVSEQAGMVRDDERGLTHLDLGRWSELLEARARGPRISEPTPTRAEWHERNALECERRGLPKAALWHLDRQIEAGPGEWWPRALRALTLGPAGLTRAWRAHFALEQSTAALNGGRWAEALASLDHLVAAYPNDISLPIRLRRTEALARLGRWEEAMSDLEAAVSTMPGGLGLGPVLETRRIHALLALKLGRVDRYRSGCEALLALASRVPSWGVGNHVAWICALGPGGVDDAGVVVRLAERALEKADDAAKNAVMNTLGASYLRAGHYEKAIRKIEEGIAHRGGKSLPQDWAFLAMAYAELGKLDEARSWSARFADWAPATEAGKFWEDLEVIILRDQVGAKMVPVGKAVR